MNIDHKKKLLSGLEFMAEVSAKAPADKQTHITCEAIYNDLKKFLEITEVDKPADASANSLLRP